MFFTFLHRVRILYSILWTQIYKLFWLKIWKNTILHSSVKIFTLKYLSIWENSYLNVWVLLDCRWWIEIWKEVSIWPYVCIWSCNHRFDNKNEFITRQGYISKKIIIEDDVWIWASATILPWVKIWKWSIVAAGAVVTKDVPEYAIVWWVPAKIISYRK